MEDGPLITGPVRSQNESHGDMTHDVVAQSADFMATMRTSHFNPNDKSCKNPKIINQEYNILD